MASRLRGIDVHHAADLAPVVVSLRAEGITSLGATAEALNERGMLTPRGGRWHKSSVRNLKARLDQLGQAGTDKVTAHA